MNTGKTISTADAVRHLIVCDTQFSWAGVTNLTLEQMMDLQARGWVVEGDDNDEFQLTVAGEAVVAKALKAGTGDSDTLQKVARKIRARADSEGTGKQHGPQYVAGLRNAANMIDAAMGADA
ncbi:hypothetical protein [Stenotrophomonas maltophilia]|uniref:hypothetical protein n=1 Tax=Stenotrophomonas maltophilia TaxID=40324 RepID=UPI0006AC4B99|nr:hypothetical protein [Stenotrophomonas maltophilia]KOQ69944.1 hypothetical protein ABW43_07370 [Stenotrophomonas maltophilia]MCU1021450.1 hypothetical protein [Stenotrophomonas maltophilia]